MLGSLACFAYLLKKVAGSSYSPVVACRTLERWTAPPFMALKLSAVVALRRVIRQRDLQLPLQNRRRKLKLERQYLADRSLQRHVTRPRSIGYPIKTSKVTGTLWWRMPAAMLHPVYAFPAASHYCFSSHASQRLRPRYATSNRPLAAFT